MTLAALLCAGRPAAAEEPESDRTARLVSAGGVAGLYGAMTLWAYFAWYHDTAELPEFTVGGDGWFGQETYAGGADKLGHAWGAHSLAHLTTIILEKGGYDRLTSSLVASGLSLGFFTFVEVKDGFYYQFSLSDSVGNALGAGLNVLLVNVPEVDEWIDFRVEYIPTDEYLNAAGDGDVNVVEDYSGQSYMLALHLAAVPDLAERPWLGWTRYVDVVGGYETRNYKPAPADDMAPRTQSLYLGVAVNMQQVLDRVLVRPARTSRAARYTRGAGHTILEHFAVPYTTLRAGDLSRSPDR